MFELTSNALAFEVTSRHLGEQHLGISPKGASDQLSFETASILLAEPSLFKCVEILYGAQVTFTKDVIFTLTGAHFKTMTLTQNGTTLALEHSKVYRANSGDRLHVKEAYIGFRLYLFATPIKPENRERIGLTCKAYSEYFAPFKNEIELIRGPEYDVLKNPSQLLEGYWKISSSSNMMGLKLQGQNLQAHSFDIISSAVSEGTIQLTSQGPIILMRHRQTTGGYPRIYQVASSAIDRLAQYPIGSFIKFVEVSMREAKALHVAYETQVKHFRNSVHYF